MKILKQGAESVIILDKNRIIKHRIKKGYRIKDIDEKIRKFRTRSEARLLEKASMNVPKVLNVDENEMKIEMEYLNGDLIKDIFDNLNKKERLAVCKQLAEEVSKLHSQDIIHGDLTTSNFILKNGKVYFIDFGLGFFSNKTEDKAVDLHLLKQALESKHYKHFNESYTQILRHYKHKDVLKRLEKVESRGRYKERK
ncbi:Kae1-associated serine/threonine protein kinase [Candidatus Woesearchaeota archaeon]|nr:Kae1-associated serine/threonine protein kinase [Candidatus Woesearchaeota archaeon]